MSTWLVYILVGVAIATAIITALVAAQRGPKTPRP